MTMRLEFFRESTFMRAAGTVKKQKNPQNMSKAASALNMEYDAHLSLQQGQQLAHSKGKLVHAISALPCAQTLRHHHVSCRNCDWDVLHPALRQNVEWMCFPNPQAAFLLQPPTETPSEEMMGAAIFGRGSIPAPVHPGCALMPHGQKAQAMPQRVHSASINFSAQQTHAI
jgi:hypothetical protein